MGVMMKHIAASLSIVCVSLFSVGQAVANDQSMNPAISMVLQGQYADYENDPEDYELPGFMLGGEAELPSEGFGLGHGELVMSANIDDLYFGKLTLALADHDGETEIELEEAYVETMGLGSGIAVRVGRSFSQIGYLNNQHSHAWDFVDAPLVYRGLFGNQLIDDGVQLSWIAPSDLFFRLGAELGRGERFPAGGASRDGKGSQALFFELGGDVGQSHSWQLGLSHWSSEVDGRTGAEHGHGAGITEIPLFTGDSDILAIDWVWKWAPEGNYANRSIKFQFEYFEREEEGSIELMNSAPIETSTYLGEQSGWYVQTVYQFTPKWRFGLRFDRLSADNQGNDLAVIAEAGLDDEGHTPKRFSVMLDHSRSEFSLVRVQFNRDESSITRDNQVFLQYVMSLGAHGAHKF